MTKIVKSTDIHYTSICNGLFYTTKEVLPPGTLIISQGDETSNELWYQIRDNFKGLPLKTGYFMYILSEFKLPEHQAINN